ncbi:lipoprotein [Spiroplasma endosymbiont of Diplazon laetatorius]|uniref:lipoprotein n=1 Tax=Spiroplasma endosymbiont of Diplazon laetatorius TaxID=3066322 RepID=UPI0030CD9D74
MKKLLTFLGAVSLTASTFSVASCSMVNYKSQSIKNKVKNLIDISSALLRGTMIQNASQGKDKTLAYDSNFLNNLIGNSKASDIIPKFKTDKHSTLNQLKETYFEDQNLNRESINQMNNNFLTNEVKAPVSSIDSFSSTFVLLVSALKTNGGLHPSISGLIEGLLPSLNLSDDLTQSLDSKKIAPFIKLIDKISDPLSKTLVFLQESNSFYSLLKNLFNSEFENAIKEKNTSEITKWIGNFLKEFKANGMEQVFDLLINSVLTLDKPAQELTGQSILNASLKRVNNIFARSSGQNDKIIDNNSLYTGLSRNFDKDLGDIIGVFLQKFGTNFNDLNFTAILTSIISEPENIVDILFVISSLLKYMSSVDFTDFSPKNDDNLFSDQKDNNAFIEELNKKSMQENPFSTKILLKNLIAITNTTTNYNGKQAQKLFYLLFNSGKKPTNIDEKINAFSLFTKLSSSVIGNEKNNYSSLVYGIGKGVAIWQKWSVAKVIGPDQVGNLFRWVITDGLGNNSDFSGLNKVLEILSGFIEIDLKVSDNTTFQLKKLFNAIWDKDSTLFKDLFGLQTSLYSLFNTEIGEKTKISDILDLIYNSISGAVCQKGDKLKNGISIISSEIDNINYTLWYQSKGKLVQFKEGSTNEKGTYNALQAFIVSSKRRGLIISKDQNKPENLNIKGTKAAMYALGTDYDSNGNQNMNKFREVSFLAGFEEIIDDSIIWNSFDDISRGFNDIKKINDEVINKVYKPLIQDKNFKTKLITQDNIDKPNDRQSITYKTVYTNPFSNEKFTYEINIVLEVNESSWKVNSIKKI